MGSQVKINTVGGQALIEGVMMRSSRFVGMAVRAPTGKIVTRHELLKMTPQFWKLPFFRGMYTLVSMLGVGMRAMNWSASQATEEEEQLSSTAMTFTIIGSILLGLGIFLFLPYALTTLIGFHENDTPVTFNFVDGLIKLVILLLYVYLISLMSDVKRVFQYHGAEHKTVHCYENKLPLTVANVKKFSTLHPRCGTSFLFIVIIIGMFVFSFTPLLAINIISGFESWVWIAQRSLLFILRIAMLPIIAGLSYEFLRWSAQYAHHPVLKILVMPGMLLQKFTTRQPTPKQIEVSIKSLNVVLRAEAQKL